MGVPFVEHASPEQARPPISEGSSSEEDDLGWQPSAGGSGDEWEDPSEGGVLTLVFRAAEHGDEVELEQLLPSLSVSVDTPGRDADTALHLAALYGHTGCARILLRHGAHGWCADDDGAVPLHDASAGGFVELTELLLDASPECVEATDEDGDTPLHNAARGGYGRVVQLLLDRGADCRAKNNEGRTALALALPGSEAAQILEQLEATAAVAQRDTHAADADLPGEPLPPPPQEG